MIPAIRGTHDILPGEIERWQHAERVIRDVCARYGYREIRTPVIEREELFAKGTGETTDIVQKEMYAFEDKGGERVTLRPEATPSMVRAYVEHALEQALPTVKLFGFGPMFRYERPQKGRYRQFHQLDVEVFGVSDAMLDAEVIEMAAALVRALGIEGAELVVNSVGCRECRPAFSQALLEALGDRKSDLCGDCRRRSETNPLRIFDCKVPSCQPIVDALPHSTDYLCDGCRAHFEATTAQLTALALDYRVSHRLVRGLDYYARTTFEVLGSGLGAQNALLGGGRYDGLVRQLGGPDRAGIGFAAGMERLVLAMPEGRGSDGAGRLRGGAGRGRAAVRARAGPRPAARRRGHARGLRRPLAARADEARRPVRGAPGAHPGRRRDRARRGHRQGHAVGRAGGRGPRRGRAAHVPGVSRHAAGQTDTRRP